MDLFPHVVTLGTAGGPRWWGAPATGRQRHGIATAVVVGSAVYLVDCGRGTSSQFAEAGLDPADLRGIFLTHLHSDHAVDLSGMLLFGWMMAGRRQGNRVRVLGPGDRGMLPPINANAAVDVRPLFADTPAAGTASMVEHLFRAYSTDLADRMFDSLRPSPYEVFATADIELPAGLGYHPEAKPTPEGMEPFTIYSDDLVTVTATLVAHPPVAPAFAFRFDTVQGSVTISGDTAPCSNLVRLARGTDLLLHEAIDLDWAAGAYADVDESTRNATIEHHRKAHTTPLQAGELATAAGAGALALHHLVPGNADPAVWRRAEETFGGPVFVPDDLETISFARSRTASAPTTSMTRD
ncbi:MAG TPA: MBL fold metallo-hydrolase [Arthrobacter sp.]|nr:MBL fold metallo-hydrolase [Arthrobacter sp.]